MIGSISGTIKARAALVDPNRYGRAAQIRSLVWSVVIAVVFVGASLLLSQLLGSN